MNFCELRDDLTEYLNVHQLEKKWQKVKMLYEENTSHPSLNVELLEPKWLGIFSLRLDLKYRALFFIREDNTAEVISFTNHYKK
ncbi:MAG: hypothetical protein HW421_823 [Ignavibacteria bacterium]|nr:hypothetical protein [Ignavibacteria bacterium]